MSTWTAEHVQYWWCYFHEYWVGKICQNALWVECNIYDVMQV